MYDQLGWPSLLRLFLGSLLSTAAKQAYTDTCRRLRFDVVKLVCNGYLLCCFNRIIIYMQNIPQNASPFPFLHFSQCICIDQIVIIKKKKIPWLGGKKKVIFRLTKKGGGSSSQPRFGRTTITWALFLPRLLPRRRRR